MLRIVIVEPETFTLLGIKGAISQSPDIEVTGDATSGKLGFQGSIPIWQKDGKKTKIFASLHRE